MTFMIYSVVAAGEQSKSKLVNGIQSVKICPQNITVDCTILLDSATLDFWWTI